MNRAPARRQDRHQRRVHSKLRGYLQGCTPQRDLRLDQTSCRHLYRGCQRCGGMPLLTGVLAAQGDVLAGSGLPDPGGLLRRNGTPLMAGCGVFLGPVRFCSRHAGFGGSLLLRRLRRTSISPSTGPEKQEESAEKASYGVIGMACARALGSKSERLLASAALT